MEDDGLALVSIDVRSGVNEAGEGFCTVIAHGQNGRMMLGQLDPETVRTMALDWLGAAEAAETDAIVFRLLREVGLPDEVVGNFVAKMRAERP